MARSSLRVRLAETQPVEVDRKGLAQQHADHLGQRQADDVGVGTDHLLHEAPREPLNGIAAGLAAPLARGDVGLDLLLAQALEPYARVDDLEAYAIVRGDQAEPRDHAVVAA